MSLLRNEASPITLELYDQLGVWAQRDQDEFRFELLEMLESFARLLQPVEDIIRDSPDGTPGWSMIVDADRAPAEWIPWGMQFVGVRPLVGLAEAEQRARWKATGGFHTGKPSSIVAAAQQYLTGTKTVYLTERHGSPRRFTVTTLVNETPDPAKVNAAIQDQKPAAFTAVHSLATGTNYAALRDTHASYAAIRSTYATYAEILLDPTRQ